MGRRGPTLLATAFAVCLFAAARADATYPGPNGPIVFNTGGDIWMMDADGSNKENLTESGGIGDERPAISPDRTKVAWMSFRQPNGMPGNSELYISDADGSNPVALTDSADNFEAMPYFSPNSLKIVWMRQTPTQDIWTMDTNGANKTNLTNTPIAYEAHPEYSPDGSKIVFVNSGHTDGDPEGQYDPNNIWVMDANGANPTQLTFDVNLDQNTEPTWSPDGLKIAWSRNGDLWTMDADGQNKALLTNPVTPAHEDQAVWSPDGSSLALTAGNDIVTTAPTPPPAYTSLTADVDTAAAYPGWAPGPGAGSAPDTVITKQPDAVTKRRRAKFEFEANPAAGASFECKFDKKPYRNCASPKQYARLSPGNHKFKVRASNGGETDPTPAKASFRVKP